MSGHDNIVITDQWQVEYYKIHKQQVDTEQFRRCVGTVLAQQCTNDLDQEIADLAFRCGQSQEAQDLFSLCRRNPMGVYCGWYSYWS